MNGIRSRLIRAFAGVQQRTTPDVSLRNRSLHHGVKQYSTNICLTVNFVRMPRVFSYCRCSTTIQDRDGADSFSRQEAQAREWCDRHGLELDPMDLSDVGVSAYPGKNLAGGGVLDRSWPWPRAESWAMTRPCWSRTWIDSAGLHPSRCFRSCCRTWSRPASPLWFCAMG